MAIDQILSAAAGLGRCRRAPLPQAVEQRGRAALRVGRLVALGHRHVAHRHEPAAAALAREDVFAVGPDGALLAFDPQRVGEAVRGEGAQILDVDVAEGQHRLGVAGRS